MNGLKKHLLVVEDDKGLQRQLRWAFDSFEVAVAGDRQEAIHQLHRVKPGVVLLDLGLPPDPGGVTEGLATLQEILSLTPQARVIIVTGNDDSGIDLKAISHGAYDFYQKPVEAGALGLMVDRAYDAYKLELDNHPPQ